MDKYGSNVHDVDSTHSSSPQISFRQVTEYVLIRRFLRLPSGSSSNILGEIKIKGEKRMMMGGRDVVRKNDEGIGRIRE